MDRTRWGFPLTLVAREIDREGSHSQRRTAQNPPAGAGDGLPQTGGRREPGCRRIRRRRSEWLLAHCAALETGTAQHLAVLFLPHALAALLDQRSHEVVTLPTPPRLVRNGIHTDRGGGSGERTRTPTSRTKTSHAADYITPDRLPTLVVCGGTDCGRRIGAVGALELIHGFTCTVGNRVGRWRGHADAVNATQAAAPVVWPGDAFVCARCAG